LVGAPHRIATSASSASLLPTRAVLRRAESLNAARAAAAAKAVAAALDSKAKRRQDDGSEPVAQGPAEYFSPTKKVRKAPGAPAPVPHTAAPAPVEPVRVDGGGSAVISVAVCAAASASASAAAAAAARDRVVSCLDDAHHNESEMVARLDATVEQRLLSADLQTQSAAHPRFAAFEGKGHRAPKITVESYLKRLSYYLGAIAEFERSTGGDKAVHSDLAFRYLISTIILIERLSRRTGLLVTRLNVHRLLITGTMVCAKVLDDIQPDAAYFADLGGVSAAELAQLEWTFVELLDYHILIAPEEFQAKYEEVLAFPIL